MKKKSIALLILASTAGWGCMARAPADYAKDTEALLATKSDELKSCYDEVLKDDSKAAGTVTVDFSVEPKTGAITNQTVNEEKSTAPKRLQSCVLTAMEGLALDPPDDREGVASFTYEFTPNKPKQL